MVTIEGMNRRFVTQCVDHFCNILGIKTPKLLIFVDDTIKVAGACYENEPGDYMIVLKARDEGQMIVTLAHEMVHIKQYLKDDLRTQFDSSVPYYERWWEKEAYDKEVTLMKSLIEQVTQGYITQ